jgi:hypothetical protein
MSLNINNDKPIKSNDVVMHIHTRRVHVRHVYARQVQFRYVHAKHIQVRPIQAGHIQVRPIQAGHIQVRRVNSRHIWEKRAWILEKLIAIHSKAWIKKLNDNVLKQNRNY